jgi:hypothetical protein
VDYLQSAKCIFAIGAREFASLDYIEMNDAGLVVTKEKDIYDKLLMLMSALSLILDYRYKAYACGSKKHQNEIIKKMLKSDLCYAK